MINRIALGTVQFGLNYGIANESGRVDCNAVREILHAAWTQGIDTLDTAVAYGESEKTLGNIGIRAWKVISKLPSMPDDVAAVEAWVKRQVQGSLERLGIDHLHGLLLHRPEQLFSARGQELYHALQKMRSDDYVRKIGVSVYSPHDLDRIFSRMTFNLVQAPLNILDRRLVDSGWALKLKEMNVELHTRSAFLQGLLLMPAAKRPEKVSAWKEIWAQWDSWLAEMDMSPLQACLQYVLSVQEVDKVVIGVDGKAHLLEILSEQGQLLHSPPVWSRPVDNVLINPSCWGNL